MHTRAPRGMGWDEKIIPWDNFFFVHPMVWDKCFLKSWDGMGWDQNFFFVPWDEMGRKFFVPSHDLKKLQIEF